MTSSEKQQHSIAFLGTHNWRAHESVRWWHAAQSAGKRAAAEAAAPVRRTDVFGVARPDMPEDAAKHLSQLQWLALKPGSDERVAAARRVEAVVCSGQGPNDVQVAKDSRRAGKAVFVESLEHFKAADLADLAAAGGAAPLMAGLYLRFDAVLQEVSELGVESVVGRPLLYQAHASTIAPSLVGKESAPAGIQYASRMRTYPVTPSLFELGIQQVDALRWLLRTEPTEVYAAGTNGAGGDVNAYEAVSLTIKTSSGALAVISLDASGGAARQRVLIVGDQSRASLEGQASSSDLQIAGINHFMDVVTAGAEPRMSPTDCLCAAAVMAAASASLRTGAPAPVSYDFSAAAAEHAPAGATATVTVAASQAGAKVRDAAAGLVEGAKALVSGGRRTKGGARSPGGLEEEGGVSTPPHQGTPPPKAVSTPESPPLLPMRGDN